MFSLETDFLKVSLLSTTSAHCIQSFAVLSILMSAFLLTSVASVLWECKLLAFSTRFRTCSMALVALVTAPTCTRLCRLLTLLAFSRLSILDIIHLCSMVKNWVMLASILTFGHGGVKLGKSLKIYIKSGKVPINLL